MKLFEIKPLACEGISFKGFSIFNYGGHFVQRIGIILAILVEGHPKNFSVKLFYKKALECSPELRMAMKVMTSME